MFRVAALAFALTAMAVTTAWAEGPLESIARHVPKDAEGEIWLTDVAASARQTGAFPTGDDRVDPLIRWTPLVPPPGFNRDILLLGKDGFRSALGFSIHDIGQMAGWGRPPAVPVVVRSSAFDAGRIGAALTARGFEVANDRRVPVWHRLDDFAFDPKRRNEEPFGGNIGAAERLALDGDLLFVSRDWTTLDALLAGGPSLMDEPDAAALLAAAYARDASGDLLDVVMLDPPRGYGGEPERVLPRNMPEERRAAFLEKYRAGGPPLPVYPRYALALWQDGARMTGAVLIPYPDAATAEVARERFARRLDNARSLMTDGPLADLLPDDRDYRIVEANGHAVLVLAFAQVADTSGRIGMVTFVRNPRERLLQMAYLRDMDVLLEMEADR